MKRKKKVIGVIRANSYYLVARAVGEGVLYGLNRAYKHTDSPTRDAIAEAVERAVTAELCEVLRFDDGE